MIQKLNITDLHKVVKKHLEDRIDGIKVYDNVPDDLEAPFLMFEVVGREPKDSKTFLREVISTYIHGIVDGASSKNAYDLEAKVREALTDDVVLPEPYELLNIIDSGIPSIEKEETGEIHFVLSIDFDVVYGLKCKI